MFNALILFSLLLLFNSILIIIGLKNRGLNTHYAFLHSRSINTYLFRVTFTFTISNCKFVCRTYIISAAVVQISIDSTNRGKKVDYTFLHTNSIHISSRLNWQSRFQICIIILQLWCYVCCWCSNLNIQSYLICKTRAQHIHSIHICSEWSVHSGFQICSTVRCTIYVRNKKLKTSEEFYTPKISLISLQLHKMQKCRR